jgi:hypothetical protein
MRSNRGAFMLVTSSNSNSIEPKQIMTLNASASAPQHKRYSSRAYTDPRSARASKPLSRREDEAGPHPPGQGGGQAVAAHWQVFDAANTSWVRPLVYLVSAVLSCHASHLPALLTPLTLFTPLTLLTPLPLLALLSPHTLLSAAIEKLAAILGQTA